MANKDQTDTERMEKIVSLCKGKGFIFQSGELYGGLNGCWDYGPLGTELKRNVKEFWWRKNVLEREDIVGMDGSILTHQAVLTASGHVGGFSDPMCDCLLTNDRLRADQIEPQSGFVYSFIGAFPGSFTSELSEATASDTSSMIPPEEFANQLRAYGHTNDHSSAKAGMIDSLKNKYTDNEEVDLDSILPALEQILDKAPSLLKAIEYKVLVDSDSNKAKKKALRTATEFYEKRGVLKSAPIPLPNPEKTDGATCFNPNNGSLLTPAKEFNLMFKTHMGASVDDDDPNSIAYLRPETAQTIFVQYKNVLDSSRLKLPFGIAQIGKAFRNEINPRNFTFRSREFEQMEIEYFCHPDDGLRLTDEWLEKRLEFYSEIGIDRNKLHVLDIPDDERAHYSQKTYDIEYDFPFGQQELEGVAYRGDYDIGKHQEHSGKSLEYFDAETKERFIPHVVEPSAGCDRTILAILCEAYDVEDLTKEGGKKDERTVMRFKPCIAPIKAAVLPLLKNKPELVAKAQEVKNLLQPHMNIFYDETAAIGRRYRRQDEVGTPFCIAIDFETLGEEGPNGEDLTDTVTVRHRDSMEQERVAINELLPWLLARIV